MPDALASAISSDRPFALLARDGRTVEVLTGEVVDVGLLADIPLTDASGARREVLALVPYRQVVERGFECHDDGAPLRCLVVDRHAAVPLADVAVGVRIGVGEVVASGVDSHPVSSAAKAAAITHELRIMAPPHTPTRQSWATAPGPPHPTSNPGTRTSP